LILIFKEKEEIIMKRMFVLVLGLSIVLSAAAESSATVYKYRIYCNTEAQNVYQWAETEPSTCPNNTAHTINPNSISIVDEQGPAIFSIKEESVPTGGYFKIESSEIDIAAGPNVDSVMIEQWPYNVSILDINFISGVEHQGDFVTVEMPSHKIFGVITQDISAGATVIPVSSTVTDNIAKGFYAELADGVNTDDLGRVISVDSINHTITMENATAHSFLAATPTYVKVTVRPVDNLKLGPPMLYQIGTAKIGASHVPANEPAKIIYTNMSASQKKLVFAYEYLY
jgi:hypothetical protein